MGQIDRVKDKIEEGTAIKAADERPSAWTNRINRIATSRTLLWAVKA